VKVFLDANILFSASNPRWLTRQLLDALEQAGVELLCSAYVWEEAERNVRAHFPWHLDELNKLKERLIWIEDTAVSGSLFESLPEKDRPVLAAAIHGQCTHLLTGDFKHFGELMNQKIGGVKIVSQRLLAEELARL
jgi:predicted nucleic acid-binding protein